MKPLVMPAVMTDTTAGFLLLVVATTMSKARKPPPMPTRDAAAAPTAMDGAHAEVATAGATGEANDADEPTGHVSVLGLGFVTNMAEYMVAADVLVSKAGPGTIAEAASVSLPVMLTSFLPGQEEGNVDFVVENGFGAFVSDSDPMGVAEVVASWLLDDKKMKELSQAASACGAPNAAAEIVKSIGDETLQWREINRKNNLLGEEKEKAQRAATAQKCDEAPAAVDGQRIGASLKKLYHSFSSLSGLDKDAADKQQQQQQSKDVSAVNEVSTTTS